MNIDNGPTVKCNSCNYYFVQAKHDEFVCPRCVSHQSIKCDCGGDKLRLPHFDWCSKKKKEEQDKMEAYKNELIWPIT